MRRYGFSLVELSIVLVILGLLTGGILAGQSLIRASELRAVTTEYQRYVAATNTFRDKYFALPGDMNNAISFWGAAHATPATCITTSSTSALTCNGDGNGIINPSAGSNEWYRFWQHLANAGLVEGSYTGVTGPTTSYSSVVGTNVPRSKISNTGWSMYYMAGTYGNTEWFTNEYNNILLYGTYVATTLSYGAALKPEEAWNIDTKIDDGKPARGRLLSLWNINCTNAADENTLTADYSLTNTALACRLAFPRIF